jgi:hypothetical protein
MSIQRWNQFLEVMSRTPDLQKEFIALAARHGIDFLGGELSEAELATVSGGTGEEIVSPEGTLYVDTLYMEQRQKFQDMLSDMMKAASDAKSTMIANLK